MNPQIIYNEIFPGHTYHLHRPPTPKILTSQCENARRILVCEPGLRWGVGMPPEDLISRMDYNLHYKK